MEKLYVFILGYLSLIIILVIVITWSGMVCVNIQKGRFKQWDIKKMKNIPAPVRWCIALLSLVFTMFLGKE